MVSIWYLLFSTPSLAWQEAQAAFTSARGRMTPWEEKTFPSLPFCLGMWHWWHWTPARSWALPA